jgi:aspartyl protease family protein
LALDTGATSTVINAERLVALGYDPAASKDRTRITTGSGVEYVARVLVREIAALNLELADFPVIAHTLPPSAGVDGLLGLDFFRDQRLLVDFTTGLISLS